MSYVYYADHFQPHPVKQLVLVSQTKINRTIVPGCQNMLPIVFSKCVRPFVNHAYLM